MNKLRGSGRRSLRISTTNSPQPITELKLERTEIWALSRVFFFLVGEEINTMIEQTAEMGSESHHQDIEQDQ